MHRHLVYSKNSKGGIKITSDSMGTRRIKPLQEELTTSMHEEFIGDEIPHLDMMVMGVFGALRRGLSIDGALKLYGITKDEYDSNLERVLNS